MARIHFPRLISMTSRVSTCGKMQRGSIFIAMRSKTSPWTLLFRDRVRPYTVCVAIWSMKFITIWSSIARYTSTSRKGRTMSTMWLSPVKMASWSKRITCWLLLVLPESWIWSFIPIRILLNDCRIKNPLCIWVMCSIHSPNRRYNWRWRTDYTSRLPQRIKSPLSWWKLREGLPQKSSKYMSIYMSSFLLRNRLCLTSKLQGSMKE